jgi:hypothetical protein
MRLKLFFFSLLFCFFASFHLVQAQQIEKYTLLAPIPINGQLTQELQGKNIFETYIPGIFTTIIAFAAVLAVVRIIWGGILYISTDAIQGKSEGKKFITESIYGLVLISAAWLILYTINPKLVEINLSITPIQIDKDALSGSPCTGCVIITNVVFKPGVGGNAMPETAAALEAFAKEYGKDTWWVTEGNPPSIQHKDTCHAAGTCIDANFIPGEVASPAANINNFVETAKKHGLTATYEVTDSAQKAALKLVGVKDEYIVVNPDAKGSHFHIKYQ